jgi:hypothetical protein
VCANHGGEVKVASDGDGSTFTIRLPLAGADRRTSEPTSGVEAPTASPTSAHGGGRPSAPTALPTSEGVARVSS